MIRKICAYIIPIFIIIYLIFAENELKIEKYTEKQFTLVSSKSRKNVTLDTFELIVPGEIFHYEKFAHKAYEKWQPNEGTFEDAGVLTLYNGRVFSRYGLIELNGHMIENFFTQNYPRQYYLDWSYAHEKSVKNLTYVNARLLVITRIDYDCYGHFLIEILPRLLMVDSRDYDLIYMPYTKKYIKEAFALLGIHKDIIIEPFGNTLYVVANKLLVPTIPSKLKNDGYYPAVFYCPKWVIRMLRERFLPLKSIKHFAERVFISRQDSHQRRIINENEIFELFRPYGFALYTMSSLTFAEQISLFNGATHIIAAHGSALTNLVFCEKNTKVLEIFQMQLDSGYYYLAQQLKLKHTCLFTQRNINSSWKMDTFVSSSIVAPIIRDFVN